MKKIILATILLIAPFVLSGCSTGTSSPTVEVKANPNNTIWTSNDSGKTWVNSSKSTDVSIANLDVISMVVNPYDENNVLVGAIAGGIFVTKDGGESWKNLAIHPEKVYGLALDPFDTNVIYASGLLNKRGKIFKSVDAGANWTELYTTASEGPLISALAVDTKNPKIIYAATSENQLLKTMDGGVSWKNIFTSKSPLIRIVFDKNNTNLFYAMALNGDVLRSKDGGVNVEYLKTISMGNSGNSNFNALEVDPNASGVVYVGGKNGIHVSKDAGDTWNEIKTLNNPATSNELIYGATQAVYRSLDGGNTWETSQFDLGKNVNIIRYSNNPSKVYLGFRK